MFMKSPYEPLMIERAEGPWLYTRDGRRILDAGAGAVVVNIGQGREEIARVAADEVIGRLNYVILPYGTRPSASALTERLARWTPPGLNHFFFASGGSEAVEAAIKFAIMYHKIKGPPAQEKRSSRAWLSYHGNTLGALSVGGNRPAPRRLRAGALRLAAYSAPILLSLPVGQDLSGMRPRMRHRARRGNPPPGRRFDRRLYRRTDDGCDRRRRPARQGILADDRRHLPPQRHPADCRRGHDRLWPHRQALRRRALESASPTC